MKKLMRGFSVLDSEAMVRIKLKVCLRRSKPGWTHGRFSHVIYKFLNLSTSFSGLLRNSPSFWIVI